MSLGNERSEALLVGTWNEAALTKRLLRVNRQPPRSFTPALIGTGIGALLLFASASYTLVTGIGVWGNNIPVAWGFAITNLVWWIGIGHAGTFISAILLLFEQRWRTALNRIAESMTLFALAQAALFPLLHLGRAWFAYWLTPYPSTLDLWPQFLSVLTWDVVAITTYGLISLMFWYLGMLPDLAAARDRAQSLRAQRAYGLFALGWRGSSNQWRHHKAAQLLLAGIATPLVLSVHSIISMDFATAKLAGWHSTIFPPYFVAGAIFSGLAMVLTLIIPLRRVYGLQDIITEKHLDLVAKLLLVTGMLVGYSYVSESFIAWQSGNEFERHIFFDTRPSGPMSWAYWTMLFCNVGVIQLLWWHRARRSPTLLFVLSLLVNLGMWLERLVLIVTSQSEDFLPSSWGTFAPSLVDMALLIGSLCFFAFLMLLMLRFVPFVPIAETRELAEELGQSEPARKQTGEVPA